MSTGTHTSRYYEDSGTYHTTTYDDNGRHSFDWDPLTGDVTGDHCVSKEDQDYKEDFPNSNIWEELENDSKYDSDDFDSSSDDNYDRDDD